MKASIGFTFQPHTMQNCVRNQCMDGTTDTARRYRQLTQVEKAAVGGGSTAVDGFERGAAVGTIAGAVFTGTTIGATRGGIIGGALGFSWGFGYGVGTVIYNWASAKLL